MMALALSKRVVVLHRALDGAGLPHAFGGALALAFCTLEPRATKDIDVNVFVGPGRLDEVVRALPDAIEVSKPQRASLRRDGQVRLWWDETPVDVFLSNHPFHGRAELGRRFVPFAGLNELPVLACADLAVFKAFYARPKDVVDVATMAVAGAIDTKEVQAVVRGLLGSGRDPFFAQVRDAADQMS